MRQPQRRGLLHADVEGRAYRAAHQAHEAADAQPFGQRHDIEGDMLKETFDAFHGRLLCGEASFSVDAGKAVGYNEQRKGMARVLERNDLQQLQELMMASEQRLFGRIEASEQRMSEKIEASEQRMSEKIEASEQRLFGRIEASEQRLSEKIEASEQRMSEKIDEAENRMKVMMESYFDPKFNLLFENQQIMMEQLAPRSRVDELEDEVKFLKSIVRQMNDEIQQLKKAI